MALLRISHLFLLLGTIIVSMLLLTNCSSFLPPLPSPSAFYHLLLDRFLLHHYPLLMCALLHLTLFALHFSAASGSSPQRAGSESSSESFPAELLINDAAEFDPLPASSTAGATVSDHEMSLDELHRRIEEFLTRARSNMRAEARSEGSARRTPSTAHLLLKSSSRMQALPRLRGQARIVMRISGNKISQS